MGQVIDADTHVIESEAIWEFFSSCGGNERLRLASDCCGWPRGLGCLSAATGAPPSNG